LSYRGNRTTIRIVPPVGFVNTDLERCRVVFKRRQIEGL